MQFVLLQQVDPDCVCFKGRVQSFESNRGKSKTVPRKWCQEVVNAVADPKVTFVAYELKCDPTVTFLTFEPICDSNCL